MKLLCHEINHKHISFHGKYEKKPTEKQQQITLIHESQNTYQPGKRPGQCVCKIQCVCHGCAVSPVSDGCRKLDMKVRVLEVVKLARMWF